MKITPEDFHALSTALCAVLVRFPRASEPYHAAGLSFERFAWDVLHASKFDTSPLYEYLNDSHIETALKRIVKPAW